MWLFVEGGYVCPCLCIIEPVEVRRVVSKSVGVETV